MSGQGGEQAGERLQKVLAGAGLGSRRHCESLIEAGRVTVNGRTAELGMRVDAERDEVRVDGTRISLGRGLVYYLLNKPRGVVVTASDPEGRPTVLELVPPQPRVFPVGRLDLDTEGLLILTNDGDLAQHLTHPSSGVEKEYLAELDAPLTASQLRRLRDGVMLEDGMTAPARAAPVAPRALRLVIHEGRNRQVRRMCAAVGRQVLRLVRTRIGPVADRRLGPGQWRPLTLDEVRSLERAGTASGGPGKVPG